MGNPFTLIVSSDADRAWERYSALVRQANQDTALWADRSHCEAIFRAHEEFRKAFLELEAA